MTAMQPIPTPDILDADRVFYNDEQEATLRSAQDHLKTLDRALHESAEYGRSMWQLLQVVREHLFRAATVDGSAALISPRGPEDWSAWAQLYAAVTSSLAGRTGDSGYGWSEAVLIARAQGVELTATPPPRPHTPAV